MLKEQTLFNDKYKIDNVFLEDLINEINLLLKQKIFAQINLEKYEKLQNLIIQNYYEILKLHPLKKTKILKIFYALRAICQTLKKYNLLIKNNLKNEATIEAEKIRKITENLRKIITPYRTKQINPYELQEKINEIKAFLIPHIQLVGQEQAIKDLQRGLSILNKNRKASPIKAKNALKTDGIWGNKTQACLCDICKNYTLKIIKKYIKKGIQNNIIFDTKNNSDIDTSKLLKIICNNIEREN